MHMKLIGINPSKIPTLPDADDSLVVNMTLGKLIKMVGEQTNGPANLFNRKEAIMMLDDILKDKSVSENMHQASSWLWFMLNSMSDEFIVIF